MKHIQLLDCTLRDGGLGLEDAFNNGFADVRLTGEDIQTIMRLQEETGEDIVELGTIEETKDDRTGFSIYTSLKEICRISPPHGNTMRVVMFRGPDIPLERIPEKKEVSVDGIRLIVRYSELRKSLDYCAALKEKGYEVFIQPMLTMRYTDAELDILIEAANSMSAYALYIVDSYGYMMKKDVERLYYYYHNSLNKEIRIGFHAHNNINLAFANVICFLNIPKDRNVIVDACATGMGQGAGNLQLELISDYLNHEYDASIRYAPILDICEIIEKYHKHGLWGYSVERLLPAVNKTAYRYAVEFRYNYHLSYSQIYQVLSAMDQKYRHRYTKDDAKKIMKQFGYYS